MGAKKGELITLKTLKKQKGQERGDQGEGWEIGTQPKTVFPRDGQMALKAVRFDCSNLIHKIRGVSMNELTRDEMRERLGNIDQIREIIVGSQIRDYNHRFEQIEANLILLQKEFRDRIEEVKNLSGTEMRGAVEALEKKIKSVSLNTQEDLTDVRQQLERTKAKISHTIESLDESLDKQTKSIREQIMEMQQTHQETIHNLRERVFEEVERRFSNLKEGKVARDDMAEILFEIGMRLKGTEFAPELREAAETQITADLLLPDHHNGE